MRDEVCGCNGVTKGAICKAIRTRACSRWTRCASTPRPAPAAALHGPGGAAADVHRRRRRHTRRPRRRCAAAPTPATRACARPSAPDWLLSIDAVFTALDWRTPNGCATCRPAINYYLISTWPKEAQDDPQSRFINERSHANIQKDGTIQRDPAHVGRRDHRADELRRIADAVDKYKIPDGQGHRRPAHRPAGREEGRPGPPRLEGHRHAPAATPTPRRCAR